LIAPDEFEEERLARLHEGVQQDRGDLRDEQDRGGLSADPFQHGLKLAAGAVGPRL